ncbi:MAG TPA: hypothetical protein H9902_15435 [Candidatus Stackebrandtia faecavium]|nr:hypothetical protein [Candidatus Stackebrandtia faecavium]
MNTHPLRRRVFTVLALALPMLILPLASPAAADPEDDSHKIEEELEKAIEEYDAAKTKLKKAEDNQEDLKKKISETTDSLDDLGEEVNDFAKAAYLNGGLPQATALIASGSPQSTIDGMSTVAYLGDQSGEQLQNYVDALAELKGNEDALAEEVKAAESAMKKKKKAKNAAKRDVEEAQQPGNGNADPAPRNPDGSWPQEGCSVNDPSGTGGCVSPRMNHFYEQAQAEGFTRYTSCYRSAEDGGEHPRGRACDFAASSGGFGGAAGGEDKTYGDNLAKWAEANADSLGVMYIIWYNQFWDPANGWGPYSGGGTGDPSSDHTNHVHISMF